MNCWDILGIEPTGDRERIRQAYERQMKFASEEETRALERAYREATGEAPVAEQQPAPTPVYEQAAAPEAPEYQTQALDAGDARVAREVVIQIRALLNDSSHQQEVNIWKAILCEPPADQLRLRQEIGRQLEHQIRPMAENGSFPASVARFLGDWFDWFSVREASQEPEPSPYPETGMDSVQETADQSEQPPQLVNFWPAVVGWIVGLAILATIFGGMGG